MVPMKLTHYFIISALLLVFLSGCKAENSAPKQDEPAVQAPAAEKTAEQTEEEREAQYKKDLLRAKRLTDNGKVLKPITGIKLDVKKTSGSLSVEDAYRSYEFRKGAIKRCYLDALIDEFEAKGTVSMTVKHTGEQTADVENYQSSVAVAGFDDCVKKAVQTWPLPAGSSFDAEISFTSRPAPNLGELREINRKSFGHDHERNHERDHGRMRIRERGRDHVQMDEQAPEVHAD